MSVSVSSIKCAKSKLRSLSLMLMGGSCGIFFNQCVREFGRGESTDDGVGLWRRCSYLILLCDGLVLFFLFILEGMGSSGSSGREMLCACGIARLASTGAMDAFSA